MRRRNTDPPAFRGIRRLIVEDSEIDRKVALALAGPLGLRADAAVNADQTIVAQDRQEVIDAALDKPVRPDSLYDAKLTLLSTAS